MQSNTSYLTKEQLMLLTIPKLVEYGKSIGIPVKRKLMNAKIKKADIVEKLHNDMVAKQLNKESFSKYYEERKAIETIMKNKTNDQLKQTQRISDTVENMTDFYNDIIEVEPNNVKNVINFKNKIPFNAHSKFYYDEVFSK